MRNKPLIDMFYYEIFNDCQQNNIKKLRNRLNSCSSIHPTGFSAY